MNTSLVDNRPCSRIPHLRARAVSPVLLACSVGLFSQS
jgi:hypothetical protein